MADAGSAYTSAFNAASARKQHEDTLAMQMHQQMLLQQKAALDQKQRGLDLAQQAVDALGTQDKAVRRAKWREYTRALGIDPKSPEAKIREDMVVNAGDAALGKARQVIAGIFPDAEDPEGLAKGIAGGMPLTEIQKMYDAKQAQKVRTNIMNGGPSVPTDTAQPGGLTTGRVAASVKTPVSTMLPDSPPTSAPGPVTASAPVSPSILGGVASGSDTPFSTVSGMFGAPDVKDPLSVANMTAKQMTMKDLFVPPSQSPEAGAGGVDAYLGKVAQRESNNNSSAQSTSSSATGLFQYTDSTWLNSIKKYKPDWAQGLNREQILDLRKDPVFSGEIAKKDAATNAALLESKGFAPTGGNLYAMHHFGPVGARALLQADPDTPVDQIMPRNVIAANPYLRNHTAGSLLSSFEKQFGSDAVGTSSGDVQSVKTETIPAGAPSVEKPTALPSKTPSHADDLMNKAEKLITAGQETAGNAVKAIAQDLKAQEIANNQGASAAQDAFTKIGEQRGRISRIQDAPGLPSITGIGARGVDIPIPGTSGSISGTVGDLSSAVGQIIGMIPGLGDVGKRGTNIADAKAQWESIKSSGLIDTLKEMQTGSKTGATGFGALDKGEREAIIQAYTATDPKKGDAAFVADLTRLDERLKAAQNKLQIQQAEAGNKALEAPPVNTLDEVAAAKAELAKGTPRIPAPYESPDALFNAFMQFLGMQ